ncbi:MAG: hypothetical protein H7320_08675 [Ferruginibacter sp.]|nr:hypothetical protein [Ferruginibacter sp.]
MKKQNETGMPEDIKTDLKHDTMEYAAAADGDDQLDTPNEDEEITADELNDLRENDADEEAYALNAAETDSQQDTDNFLTAPDEVDELEDDELDEEDIELRR